MIVQAKTKPQESAIKHTAACSSSPNLILLCFFSNKNSSPNATNFIFKHSLKSSLLVPPLPFPFSAPFSLFLSLSCPLLQQPLLFLYLIPQALQSVYITQQFFFYQNKKPFNQINNKHDKYK